MSDFGPIEVREIRVTERQSFRSCKRAWYWGKFWRSRTPHVEAWFGTGMHHALETWYQERKNGNPPLEPAQKAFREWFIRTVPDIEAGYRMTWSLMESQIQGYLELGLGMLENYLYFDQIASPEWEVVSTEENVSTKIPKTRGTLAGRVDLVIRQPNGALWVVDHKTRGTQPDSRNLDLDDQLTGYAYLIWKNTGEVPENIIFNTLIRVQPSAPRRLASGKFSVDRSQGTTLELFLEAIKEAGQPEEDYAPFIAYLSDQGYRPFFNRMGQYRTLQELRSFEERLFWEYKEMREVGRNPVSAIPEPNQYCSRCEFLAPCLMKERGDDWVSFLDLNLDRVVS